MLRHATATDLAEVPVLIQLELLLGVGVGHLLQVTNEGAVEDLALEDDLLAERANHAHRALKIPLRLLLPLDVPGRGCG
eukprot:scaffold502503_cov38-Prasinocladus_malaysianus.AAC.1